MEEDSQWRRLSIITALKTLTDLSVKSGQLKTGPDANEIYWLGYTLFIHYRRKIVVSVEDYFSFYGNK